MLVVGLSPSCKEKNFKWSKGSSLGLHVITSGRTFLWERIASLVMTTLGPVISWSAAAKQSLLVMKSGTELTKSNTECEDSLPLTAVRKVDKKAFR